MQKLLEQTPVILGDCLTGQSENGAENRKAESIDEPEKEEIPCLMIKKKLWKISAGGIKKTAVKILHGIQI